jgi:putative methyltransferase (TIGR04325 family)
MRLAPIVLFVYNRPWHTEQTLNALAANELAEESVLYIYADGPKHNAPGEVLQNIKKTREIIRKKKWCKEVFIIEREENQGLATSIINGVTEIVNQHGKVIVLEDDIVASKYFLQYMNDALNIYENEQKVISIGALNFFAVDKNIDETFFVPIPDCWGWATWKNRWQLFEPNAQKLINRLRESGFITQFNLHGAFDFESMLIDQIQGKISSWAIRWQAVAYLENKLTLYPKYSVTKNIGFGVGGTHGGNDKFSKHIRFAKHQIKIVKIPVEEDPNIIKKMVRGYWKITQPGTLGKMKLQARVWLKSLLPPIVPMVYRKLRPCKNNGILWLGNFPDWHTAKSQCSGYDDPLILEKTKNAILKVKNGEAASERDSVLFDKIYYCWPITAFLLKVAIENNNELSVIDFGGSLGSSYFQNKNIIPGGIKLSWNVVEQPGYVDVGNREIKDEHVSFYYSIGEAFEKKKDPVLLLSSVLPYLENPYEFLNKVMRYNFKYIIVDRTAFIDGQQDRITIQTVPDSIYKSAYPAWFLNNDKFKKYFSEQYNPLLEFDSDIIGRINLDRDTTAYWKGYIFQIKTK